MSGIIQIVVGGQFGSEGKGAVAGYLTRPAESLRYPGSSAVCAVRVAGPNAGHTVMGRCPPDCDGRTHAPYTAEDAMTLTSPHPWRLRQVPVGAVTNPAATLVIAAGSEIDEPVLRDEVDELDAAGYEVSGRLLVDQSATVIDPQHQTAEKDLVASTGSTGKGVGAARAYRALRQADLWGGGMDTGPYLRRFLADSGRVVIEGTQGYGLGTHAGFYPHCTSSDCRAIDFLSMAGLTPWASYVGAVETYLVLRTRPIRIAGPSGPLHGETTWRELGLSEEITTVTQKVRRVGEWDQELAEAAIEANGGCGAVRLVLTMADQRWPELAGVTDPAVLGRRMSPDARTWMNNTSDGLGCRWQLVGTGPDAMVDLR